MQVATTRTHPYCSPAAAAAASALKVGSFSTAAASMTLVNAKNG